MVERFAQATQGIQRMFWATSEADGLDLGPQGLLVESFLDGREYLIEAVAWDGELYLGSVVDRITAEGGTFDDDVHDAPTSLSAERPGQVHRVVTPPRGPRACGAASCTPRSASTRASRTCWRSPPGWAAAAWT